MKTVNKISRQNQRRKSIPIHYSSFTKCTRYVTVCNIFSDNLSYINRVNEGQLRFTASLKRAVLRTRLALLYGRRFMSKKWITWVITLLVLVWIVPNTAWAEDNTKEGSVKAPESQSEGSAEEAELWKSAIKAVADPEAANNKKTKYAVKEAAIYKAPDEQGEVLDVSKINTSFEEITQKNGWSVITTQGGAAFMRSDTLADEPIEKWRLNYTDDDLYIMAHALAGECQDCPDQEQLYVGSVILNRVAHPSFPNTIRDVVFQRGQYACTRDGNYYREPTQRNWENAKTLLEEGSVLPANVVWQSGRRQGKGVYIKTRYHYYCY